MAKETSNSESLACIEECLRKKYEQDLEYYKDQISRQEATIAAHQERLGRVLKASRRASAKSSQQQGNISYIGYNDSRYNKFVLRHLGHLHICISGPFTNALLLIYYFYFLHPR